MEKIEIFAKGRNGSTVFSVKTQSGGVIIKDKTIAEVASYIVDNHKELSEKINTYYRTDFAGGLPENIDISLLDPSKRVEIIKEISRSYERV